jgi:hypothetical protein
LLPDLRAVVLSGLYAQKAWRAHIAPFVGARYSVIETWHPSPLAINRADKREQFWCAVESAAAFV